MIARVVVEHEYTMEVKKIIMGHGNSLNGGDQQKPCNSKPVFKKHPGKEIKLNKGCNGVIGIKIKSLLPTTVKWMFEGTIDGVRIQYNIDGGWHKLIFNTVEDSDRGIYKVIASNSAGKTEKSFNVRVAYRPPDIKTICHTNSKTSKIIAGEDIFFAVYIHYHGHYEICWFKGDLREPLHTKKRISVVKKDSLCSLEIKTADVTDTGKYTCEVTGEDGVRRFKEFNVVVQEIEKRKSPWYMQVYDQIPSNTFRPSFQRSTSTVAKSLEGAFTCFSNVKTKFENALSDYKKNESDEWDIYEKDIREVFEDDIGASYCCYEKDTSPSNREDAGCIQEETLEELEASFHFCDQTEFDTESPVEGSHEGSGCLQEMMMEDLEDSFLFCEKTASMEDECNDACDYHCPFFTDEKGEARQNGNAIPDFERYRSDTLVNDVESSCFCYIASPSVSSSEESRCDHITNDVCIQPCDIAQNTLMPDQSFCEVGTGKNIFVRNISYSDIVELEKTLHCKLGDHHCWEMLCGHLSDKGLVRMEKRDIEVCRYPGCRCIGESFIRYLSVNQPDLTVEKFCKSARKRGRNDICNLLAPYMNEKLEDIPYMEKTRLEAIFGLSHYHGHRECSWKIIAEDVGIVSETIEKIETANGSTLTTRSSVEEMFQFFKTRSPSLTLQEIVGSLRHLGINDSADTLDQIILTKQLEEREKEGLHFAVR